MNEQLTIIEIDTANSNIYYPNIIMVKDITKKDVLIHEMTHHLLYKGNDKLLAFIEILNEDGEFTDYFNYLVSEGCFDNYPESDWWEEHIAYFMEFMDESDLRFLDIDEYNKILNGDFKYYKMEEVIKNEKM